MKKRKEGNLQKSPSSDYIDRRRKMMKGGGRQTGTPLPTGKQKPPAQSLDARPKCNQQTHKFLLVCSLNQWMDFCSVRGRDLSTFTAQCVCMGRDSPPPPPKKRVTMTISRNTGTALYGKTKEKSGEANHDVVVVDSLTLFFLSLSIADEVDVFSTPTITFCLCVRKW
jgi:hypothetical protein